MRFSAPLPAAGPVVVALAGTMLDPGRVFSRLMPPPGVALVSADWMLAARGGGLRSAATALADALARRREPVAVLGHSSGGALALMLAIDRPELVSGLLLANTGANTRGHGDPDAPKRLAGGISNEVVEAFLDRCFVAPLPPGLRQGLKAYALSCPADCVVAAMTSQREMDLEPSLPRVGCPVAIVHGALDRVRTREHVDVLLRGIGNATAAEVPCGHTPPWEEPQATGAALCDLLKR